MTPHYDVVVVGAGIVGLATAHALTAAGAGPIAVVERESGLARHQTGRNSGVIHSGLYYAPGSLKAALAVAGCAETVTFCRRHDLPHRVCGKLVVATGPAELPRLAELARRGRANGVAVRELDAVQVRGFEPHVRALAALHVPSTGVCDFGRVAGTLGELLRDRGVTIYTGRTVQAVMRRRADAVVRTDQGDLLGARVVVCAGLHADELARRSGVEPGVRIVPFRGEYAALAPRAAGLVRGLVYPVPNPAFPFLGVHATRGVHGEVHVGPNAVLALAREGYSWTALRPRECAATLAYPGFARLAARHWRYGLGEVYRSLSRRAMAAAVARMLPGVGANDLVPAGAGVRAQAVRPDGSLVDDFLFARQGEGEPAVLHVLNAPSPAATAALPIGREIARWLTGAHLPPVGLAGWAR